MGLMIKKSGIPDAGFGLFTTKFISSGVTIGEYRGDIIVKHDKDYYNPYALQIKVRPPTFIDASRTDTCEMRFSNDARCPHKNNTSFYYNSKTKKTYLQSTREIQSNEELFCNYGETYYLN